MREGRTTIDNPMQQSISSVVAIAQVDYGITANWMVQGVIPFLDQTFISSGSETHETGFGDLTAIMHYSVPARAMSAWRFRLGAGISLPVGNGIENPISSDRNLTSGTIDPMMVASALYLTGGPVSIDGSLFVRPILFTDDDDTRTGSFFHGSLGLNYGWQTAGISARVGVIGIHRLQDKVNGEDFASSGGQWIYLTPGLIWQITGSNIHGMQLAVSVEIPVYRNVRGTQLVEDAILIGRIFYGLGG